MVKRGGGEGRTLLQRLETLKGDLELVLVGELGGVVEDVDPEEGDDRHGGRRCGCFVDAVLISWLLLGVSICFGVARELARLQVDRA
jgi:hypothetical protein